MNQVFGAPPTTFRAVLAAAVTFFAASAAAPAAPTIVNIGTLGGAYTWGNDINDSGVVVGYESDAAGNPTAFRWTAATGLTNLGPGRYANAVNASGDAVGYDANNALYWAAGSDTPTPLPNLGGTTPTASAAGINAAGQIVGNTTSSDPVSHVNISLAYLTTTAGPAIPLGVLTSDGTSHPYAINDAGAVVGVASASDGSNHAFLWTSAGGMTDLGAGPGSTAYAINNSGVVVGSSSYAGPPQAFVVVPGQSPMTLPTVGSPAAMAYDVNDAGYIVGSNGGIHALLWNPADYSAAPTDLDAWLDSVDPVDGAHWTLTHARAINNSGLVVGYGVYDGAMRSFVLDVSSLVPEPASLAFPLLAAAMAFRTPRRRRNA